MTVGTTGDEQSHGFEMVDSNMQAGRTHVGHTVPSLVTVGQCVSIDLAVDVDVVVMYVVLTVLVGSFVRVRLGSTAALAGLLAVC